MRSSLSRPSSSAWSFCLMLMVRSLDIARFSYCSLLTAYGSLVSRFSFAAKLFFDCLTHQLRRGIWIEAFKMFHDAAVARDDEALRNHALAVDDLHQRGRHRPIVPDNSVIDPLRANEVPHEIDAAALVISSRQSQHDQPARLVLVVHLDEFGHLLLTRSAPRSPDIHDHHLVGEIRKLD